MFKSFYYHFKNRFPIFLLFCSFILNAQTNRIYYSVKFKLDSLSDNYEEQMNVLDINKDEVKFYPADILVKDSLRLSTGIYNYSYNKFGYKIKRKRNSNINKNFVSLSPNYYVYETKDVQKWEIKPETKSVNGIVLQKATTNFGGRNWEAWFSTSIPFQEGPYKFRGLPGLIFELQDDKKNFIFSFIEK